MSERWDRISSAILTVAAVVIAATFVYRTLHPIGPRVPVGGDLAGERIPAWEDVLPAGIVLGGDSLAPVTIVEFGDLECPACRQFHANMHELLRSHPEDVRVVFVNFPLGQHRFAEPAARAAECADSVGAALRWIDVVYEQQDSLGFKPWGQLAQDAQISDTGKISQCARTVGSYERINAGKALGGRFRVHGTPTVFVNGWKFPGVPTMTALDSAVTALLAAARH